MASSNGYGALNGSGRDSSAAERGDEEQPLLGGRPSKPGWRKLMTMDVCRDWADLVLLLCYIITGLLDSASISTWGSFVSMQTGNTVYFGLGLAAPHESTRWIKSGTSLGCFCVGSVFFSRFHRLFSPKRRWVLCASFAMQMLFIVSAAAIVTFGPQTADAKEAIGWPELVPIALVAFQSCGQAVVSRALKYNALTSVVLTSIYCDLFSDAELLTVHNPERNRRVGAPVLLLVGAVLGGLLAHSSVGTAGVLWIASGLKLIVVVAWFVWPAEKE
ncbi:Uu.00g011490.m01.CDS01 [Anthostomella pinea]|uniref:Uu.00g011490.m01.CDS01 n=1 Tax=Anthostomella pinea TaxID=933095 RepID=A0AAI8VYD8_9PEZI|nr:Uu.00g011490.m01.CDS01 [Anthostomella pinea]